MEAGKYSLNLRETLYVNNLYKSSFTHGCYFNVFTSCRKQTIFDDCEVSKPKLTDFTSINAVDNMMLSQAFPKSKSFSVGSPLEDICLKIVQHKRNYNKYFQHCQRKYKKQAKLVNMNVKKRRNGNFLPMYMINLCNMNDPDPYLDTFYDWYYTGGVLDIVTIDNQNYFIGIFENNLCIRSLNNAKIKQKYHLDNGQIYNIKSCSYNNKNYVTLRSKNNLKLMHFQVENETFNIHEDWHAYDKTPYIDCKLYSKGSIGSINMQNLFKCFDIETQTLLFEHKISETTEKPNRFCLFDAIDKRNLLFMSREFIKSFDVRSSDECKVLSLETFPMNHCEQLCNFLISKCNSNYLFACTSHNIVKVDLRIKKILKQWSHLLTSPPLMIDSIQNNNEYLCISSFKDRIVLCSTPEENNLPKLVPSPKESFNKVNLEQNIILEDLTKRLQSSINGLKLSNNNDKVAINYSNAFGDLFCNDIQLKSISQSTVNDKSAFDKMKKWLKSLQRKESKDPKPLYATEIATEWSSIKQLHCKSILEDNLAKYTDESLVKLNLDIDPFDFDMSAIWGARTNDIYLPEESSPVKKVTDWLNRATKNGKVSYLEKQ